ncbi:MAG: hypothetical protein LUQ16_02830 [Methanomassiliicoccales archaeon]|nr:hypothetical protein [Methanomassiliicoccales archaeon]MDD1755513.1 hypothetical protein [Methanomassiliicoccales archaeon]
MSQNSRRVDPEVEQDRFRREMDRIEAIILDRAKIAFSRKERLRHAFQHRSFQQEDGRATSYERLEFLGDRVLELCVVDWLYQNRPSADEGELSKELDWRVDETNLARVDKALRVRKALRLGPSLGLDEVSDKMVADAVEALLGAIYLDVGLDAAQRFVRAFVPLEGDPPVAFRAINELQELCASKGLGAPLYDSARDHDDPDYWVVFCHVGDERREGRAKRKTDAKKQACLKMLSELSGMK